MNSSFAVASKRKTVSHVTTTVLAQIKCMFPLVRVLRISVRDNHLCQRQSIEYGSLGAFVVVGDVIENNSLLVVETDMNLELLPLDHSALDLERNTFWLGDVDWFDIGSVADFFFYAGSMIVIWFRLANWSSDFWDINVNDLLLVGVKDRTEIEREGVLAIIYVRSVIH
jgi:hypothetical protein